MADAKNESSSGPAAPQSKEHAFVKENFREYYLAHGVSVPSLSMREFGFGFEKKIDIRHKAFASQKELQDYFTAQVPLYASYSAAFYEYPSARPMQNKAFSKAELIFDLDADAAHEGHNGAWCEACQKKVKSDCIRLLEDFLFPDFGFSKGEVAVNFSGSKGYHVHVNGKDAVQLSASQRAQLVEYAGGTNIDFQRFFFVARHEVDAGKRRAVQVTGPSTDSKGWGKKLVATARGALSLPPERLVGVLKGAGYSKKQAEEICANRENLSASVDKGLWSAIERPMLFAGEIIKRAGDEHKVALDRGVTVDMARLIRIPDTLHGDSGLLAKTTAEISSFDPANDAIAFSQGAVDRLIPLDDYEFPFGDTTYGLKKERLAEAPLAVAMLLLCKKKALLL